MTRCHRSALQQMWVIVHRATLSRHLPSSYTLRGASSLAHSVVALLSDRPDGSADVLHARMLQVLASYGHVRDLPARAGAVDPDDGFAMQWALVDRAAPQVACRDWPLFDRVLVFGDRCPCHAF